MPILVIGMILLVTGCGGSSDSSENVVTDAPAPPQDGITGTVASKMSGAALSVADANGVEIVIASGRMTDANGNYHLIFSEFEINEGITAPLVITADGSSASAICDFDAEGNSDCRTKDGSFAAFGETYELPDGFTLRGVSSSFPEADTAGDRLITVNISAASDLATSYALRSANGAALTAQDVSLASRQALGVVEFTTALTTTGSELNLVPIIDLTAPGSPSTSSLALALFGAGLHGQVDTEVSSRANYRLVLNAVESNILPRGQPATNQLRASGTFLAQTITGFLETATTYQASLTSPSIVLSGSIAAQTTSIPLLNQAGGNQIVIGLPADPGSNAPLDRTKTFTAELSEVMGASLLISSSDAFGGTASGAATVFTDQLSLLETLVANEVRTTLIQLDTAIASAILNGEAELIGTNVSGILATQGDTVTLSTATSTTSNIQTGISVNATIASAVRDNAGGTGTFNASDITINIARVQNDLTSQELFDGALVLSMTAGAEAADIESLSYTGNLRAASGLEFVGEMSVTGLSPFVQGADATTSIGSYDATFTFTEGSSLRLEGELENQINLYTISAGSSIIITDLETNTITDMTTSLNLSLDQSGTVTGGTLTAIDTTTGSMDEIGIVTFSDGTSISLPSPVI